MTEILSQVREAVRQHVMQRFSGCEQLAAEDIGDVLQYSVTRPRRVALNERLIRPTEAEA